MKSRRWFRSIFSRIIIVMILASALIHLVVALLVRQGVRSSGELHRLGHHHLDQYVTCQLGDFQDRPGEASAAELAARLEMDLRIQGPGLDYSSRPGLPDVETATRHLFRRPRGGLISRLSDHRRPGEEAWPLPVGRHEGRLFTLVERQGYGFVILLPGKLDFTVRGGVLVLGFALLSLILVGLWLWLRRLLLPLRAMNQAVGRLAGGDLDVRLPVQEGTATEMQELGQSFNHMAGRVSGMVQHREQLLLDISHEIRTPLTRLRLALELPDPASRQPELVADLSEVEAVLEQVLSAARRNFQQEAARTFDLVPVIDDLVEKNGKRTPGIRFAAMPATFMVHGDPEGCRTVLRNVLENALKYSPADGPAVEVWIDAGAGLVKIRDGGPGIPADEQEQVFEPFHRVDPSRDRRTGGYGLGLAMVRRIMTDLGGTVELDSRPGAGTTVILRFPPGPASQNDGEKQPL